jgi:hypothetical protein
MSSSAAVVVALAVATVKKLTTNAAAVWSMAIDELTHGLR